MRLRFCMAGFVIFSMFFCSCSKYIVFNQPVDATQMSDIVGILSLGSDLDLQSCYLSDLYSEGCEITINKNNDIVSMQIEFCQKKKNTILFYDLEYANKQLKIKQRNKENLYEYDALLSSRACLGDYLTTMESILSDSDCFGMEDVVSFRTDGVIYPQFHMDDLSKYRLFFWDNDALAETTTADDENVILVTVSDQTRNGHDVCYDIKSIVLIKQ